MFSAPDPDAAQGERRAQCDAQQQHGNAQITSRIRDGSASTPAAVVAGEHTDHDRQGGGDHAASTPMKMEGASP